MDQELDIDTSVAWIIQEHRRLSELVDRGIAELLRASLAYAEAEETYRKEKALAWVNARANLAEHRRAEVDGATAELRKDRDIAHGTMRAASQAVKARSGQLDALRSVISVLRSEMDLGR